ncbi:MAG: endonuclease/exonuclease/phosphatase family protein [Halioglobus sp.]
MIELCMALSLFFVIATAMPVVASEVWWVRVFDFPRLQLFTLSSFLVSVELLLLDITAPATLALAALGSLCAASQLARILPFSPLWKKQVRQARRDDAGSAVSVLVANVLTSNRDAGPLLAFIQQQAPDVIVGLETDPWWEGQLAPLAQRYPHRLQQAQDNLYGMHLLSRYPLEDASVENLVQSDVPSMHALLRLPCGAGVRLHALHPAPPFPGENPVSQPRDVEILVVARSLQHHTGPTIVAGDLNDVPWSRTLRSFLATSGLGDPRRGRGLYNSFHAAHRLLRWPLDHVFVSHHFSVRRIVRSANIGSDHFAYLVGLALDTSAEGFEDAAASGGKTTAWTRDKLQDEAVAVEDVPTPKGQ